MGLSKLHFVLKHTKHLRGVAIFNFLIQVEHWVDSMLSNEPGQYFGLVPCTAAPNHETMCIAVTNKGYGHVLISPNITSVDGQFPIENETYSYGEKQWKIGYSGIQNR